MAPGPVRNPAQKRWTREDEEFVMKHAGQHGDMTIQQIADKLGRTKSAISVKRSILLDRQRFAKYREEHGL